MTRTLPQMSPRHRGARIWFEPNGGHELEVSLAAGELFLTRDDMAWLREVFEAFDAMANFEDGRDTVVQRRFPKPLEVG